MILVFGNYTPAVLKKKETDVTPLVILIKCIFCLQVVKTRRAGKLVIGRECDASRTTSVIREAWVLGKMMLCHFLLHQNLIFKKLEQRIPNS